MTGDSDVRQGVSLKAAGKLVCVRHAEAVLHVVRCRARSAPGPGISVCCAGQQRVSLAAQRATLQWAMRPFELGRLLWQMHRKASKGCWGAVRFAVPVEEPYSKLASARWRGRPWCSSPRAPLRGATPMTAGRGAYPRGFFGGLVGRGYLDAPPPPVLSLGTGGGS